MSWCMNGLARSELSENTIKKKCKESGLTDAKTEVLVNTFKINSNFWHNMLVFSNTQDTIRVLERIDKKDDQILRALDVMSQLLKNFMQK